MKAILKKVYVILPLVCIVIFGMFVVFYAIDFVNPVMNFIYNDLTKGLLVLLSVCGIVSAGYILKENKRAAKRLKSRNERHKKYLKSK